MSTSSDSVAQEQQWEKLWRSANLRSGNSDQRTNPFPTNRSHLVLTTEQEFHAQWDVTRYIQTLQAAESFPDQEHLVDLLRQWHSIQSVWNFMETYEHQHWKRFQRIGLFSLDAVYYDPIPILSKEDAVIPSAIKHNENEEKMVGWNKDSALFYGARDVAKIWATDRLNSVNGYREWQWEQQSIADNSIVTVSRNMLNTNGKQFMDYLLRLKWMTEPVVRNICFRQYTGGTAVTADKDIPARPCEFMSPPSSSSNASTDVPGVVVLGMHRSGTSLLAGLLSKGLSYYVPGELMVGNAGNKYGYFENKNVAFQNNLWLNEQGLSWDKLKIRTDPNDSRVILGGFNPNLSCLTDYCAEAKHKPPNYFVNLNKSLFYYNNATYTPWLLKEPRLCITLPN